MNRIFLSICLFSLSVVAWATDTLIHKNILTTDNIIYQNLLLNTNNSANIFFNNINVGQFQFQNIEYSGNAHLLLNAPSVNKTIVSSEGYTKIGSTSYFGNFFYNNQFDDNSNWSNNLFPYSVAPLNVGDSIESNYYKEFYSLGGGFATPLSSNFVIGSHLEYLVGSGVTKIDPRVHNNYLDLTFSSGVIYHLANFKFGFDIQYTKIKEKLRFAKLLDKDYWSYISKGMGRFETVTGLEDLSLNYITEGWGASSFISFSISEFQNIIELSAINDFTKLRFNQKNGITIGDLESNNFEFNYHLQFINDRTHRLSLHSNILLGKSRSAEGFRIVNVDGEHIPEFTVYQPRFNNTDLNFKLSWLSFKSNDVNSNSLSGIAFINRNMKYLTSKKIDTQKFTNIEFFSKINVPFNFKRISVVPRLQLAYSYNLFSSSSNPINQQSSKSISNYNFLLSSHDLVFNSSDRFSTNIGFKLFFFLKNYTPYIDLDYQYFRLSSNILNMNNRSMISITIGLKI